MPQVDTIAVLGAGDMGHGIAELCALNGYTVTLRDIEDDIVQDALDKVEWSLGKLSEKGEITDEIAEDAFSRISGTTDLAQAVSDVDLVIEAVPEDLSLKQKVFADVEQHVPDDAVLASNTSTMRITEIGEKLEDPSRLVGMHFFNPVLLMDLVEIIPSDTATDEAVETIEEVSDTIGKTYVTLDKDTPGFVTSRLAGIFVGAAIEAHEQGMASKEEIDAAIKFKAGFPMGPFELADYTGLDIGLHAGDYMAERLGDAYRPPKIQRDLVEAGKLGKKTGEGFYPWEGDKVQVELSPDEADRFEPDNVLALVANEAARLLQEGIASADDIDLAMKNGLAFPKGPLEWADGFGLDNVLETLETLHGETGNALAEPVDAITERVDAGKTGRDAGEGFFTYATAEGETTSFETVEIEIDEDAMVATVTLDRPHRLNAINDQLITDLEAAFTQLDDDEDVRAIVLKGKGDKAFSVGADLQDVGGFTPAKASQVVRDGHRLCMAMDKLGTPLIAAVDGYAFGGGLELTLPCDFRLASTRARFQLPEVTLGLLPGMGGTFRLPKLIGTSYAKEIAMLGERITAERGYEMGLVHRVWETAEFDEKVAEFAANLAGNAPIAMRFIRSLVEEGHNASTSQAMEAEAGAFGVLASTDDVIEGVTSMFQKTEPEFEGR